MRMVINLNLAWRLAQLRIVPDAGKWRYGPIQYSAWASSCTSCYQSNKLFTCQTILKASQSTRPSTVAQSKVILGQHDMLL